jgi:hypothetical protein
VLHFFESRNLKVFTRLNRDEIDKNFAHRYYVHNQANLRKTCSDKRASRSLGLCPFHVSGFARDGPFHAVPRTAVSLLIREYCTRGRLSLRGTYKEHVKVFDRNRGELIVE